MVYILQVPDRPLPNTRSPMCTLADCEAFGRGCECVRSCCVRACSLASSLITFDSDL